MLLLVFTYRNDAGFFHDPVRGSYFRIEDGGAILEYATFADFVANANFVNHGNVVAYMNDEGFFYAPELFVPAALPREGGPRDFNYLFPFARLKTGDAEAAQATMSRIVGIEMAGSEWVMGWGIMGLFRRRSVRRLPAGGGCPFLWWDVGSPSGG